MKVVYNCLYPSSTVLCMARRNLPSKQTLALASLLVLLLPLSTVSVMNMDQVRFNFSLKNIPIPCQKDYLLELISSVGTFVSNLRYRSWHFLNPSENRNQKETFGFKTTEPAPSIAELKEFEDDLYELVKNVKFRPIKQTTLQSTLKQNMVEMSQNNDIYVAADKTENYYRISKIDHDRLVSKNVRKDYKKGAADAVNKVNAQDKKIAEDLELDNRIYAFSEREAYVTIKDHKENYRNNTKCRLINPAKTDMGKVSKKILSKIVTSLRESSPFIQWKNSFSVIEWFKGLQNKKKLNFIQFDIVEFYPNITEDILKKALEFAKQYVPITSKEIDIVLKTKKSLLFTGGQPWVKKGTKQFDVTMGSWDGAEVADLVGLYILSKLAVLNIQIGLYRDDGLAVSGLSARQTELTKKKLCKLMKDLGFNITAQAVNFLDINLDLESDIFKPYMKPNSTPCYVHRDSNHPRAILENIPKSVNKRLSAISSNKQVFDLASPPYQEALQKSGYDFKLNFEPPIPCQKSKNRKRNITYFNPPFSKNVQTRIGDQFLNLIDKHFPRGHPLQKIINRNTIKLSYRCMPNFKRKVAAHNSRVNNIRATPQPPSGCNCTGVMGPCPLEGNCLVNSVVYEAEVTSTNHQNETYTGLTSNTFKKRYYKHRESFKKENSENSTTLSSFIWNLKRKNENFEINWRIKDRAAAFNPVSRKCYLCLKEKYFIIFQPEGASLNLRSELFSTCRHRLRQLLANT